MTRKSAGRISDELAALDARTRYLTPIFGSEASDVAMPDKNCLLYTSDAADEL